MEHATVEPEGERVAVKCLDGYRLKQGTIVAAFHCLDIEQLIENKTLKCEGNLSSIR